MNNLEYLNKKLLLLHDETKTNPLKFARWTPPQLRFLKSQNKFTLLRGGNQIGKSYVAAGECIYRCLGHPYKNTTPPPVTIWVIAHSWSQSIEIQNRLFELVPKNELSPSTKFTKARGFKGQTPVITFRNGSIIRIKTTNQTGGKKGTISLASGSVDYVLIDEPPPPQILSELVARILRKNGDLSICMTPVGVPCDHIKKMVDDGIMIDINAPLTVKNLTPVSNPGEKPLKPLLSKEAIEDIERSYMEFDRSVRMTGSWEGFHPHGIIFDCFRDEMIDTALPIGDMQYSVGIDHGSQEGAQFACLIGVRIPDRRRPKSDKNDYHLHVLDEYYSGAAKATLHAKGILNMLKRNNLQPRDIFRWVGDRPHSGDRYGSRMSNTMLRSAFSHILGTNKSGSKGFRIHTAYKPAFSVYYGCRLISELMMKNQFTISPKAKMMIKSIKNWAILKTGKIDRLSSHKHAIDALRYSALCILDRAYRAPKNSHIKIIR